MIFPIDISITNLSVVKTSRHLSKRFNFALLHTTNGLDVHYLKTIKYHVCNYLKLMIYFSFYQVYNDKLPENNFYHFVGNGFIYLKPFL